MTNNNYGAKFREIYNMKTHTSREVYSPVIYKENGDELLVSKDGKILEFDNEQDAISIAKDTYYRFKEKNN